MSSQSPFQKSYCDVPRDDCVAWGVSIASLATAGACLVIGTVLSRYTCYLIFGLGTFCTVRMRKSGAKWTTREITSRIFESSVWLFRFGFIWLTYTLLQTPSIRWVTAIISAFFFVALAVWFTRASSVAAYVVSASRTRSLRKIAIYSELLKFAAVCGCVLIAFSWMNAWGVNVVGMMKLLTIYLLSVSVASLSFLRPLTSGLLRFIDGDLLVGDVVSLTSGEKAKVENITLLQTTMRFVDSSDRIVKRLQINNDKLTDEPFTVVRSEATKELRVPKRLALSFEFSESVGDASDPPTLFWRRWSASCRLSTPLCRRTCSMISRLKKAPLTPRARTRTTKTDPSLSYPSTRLSSSRTTMTAVPTTSARTSRSVVKRTEKSFEPE